MTTKSYNRWYKVPLGQWPLPAITHLLAKAIEDFKKVNRARGIDLEEKAFYDTLRDLAIKYDFTYPDDKLLELTKAIKVVVDDKVKYTDWNQREDFKAELKVGLVLVLVLTKHGYPPVDRGEVYKEVFVQAGSFKAGQYFR